MLSGVVCSLLKRRQTWKFDFPQTKQVKNLLAVCSTLLPQYLTQYSPELKKCDRHTFCTSNPSQHMPSPCSLVIFYNTCILFEDDWWVNYPSTTNVASSFLQCTVSYRIDTTSTHDHLQCKTAVREIFKIMQLTCLFDVYMNLFYSREHAQSSCSAYGDVSLDMWW